MTLEPLSGAYDTLAGESSIRLFGRTMWDIVLRDLPDRSFAYGGEREGKPIPPRFGENEFLIRQLNAENARLARISCFAYRNQLFDLARPAIFLVHGDGEEVKPAAADNEVSPAVWAQPPIPERSGLDSQVGSFAPHIRVWLYDRADFTIRLDTQSGSFERVLLDCELGGIRSGSMGAGDSDDVPPPPKRRRKWRAGDVW